MYKLLISWTGTVMGFVSTLILGFVLIQTPVDAAPTTTSVAHTTGSTSFSYMTQANSPTIPHLIDDVMTKKEFIAYQTELLKGEKPSMTPHSRYVTLTFDDGPSPYTPQILEILKKYNIRATFFVLGANAQAYQDLIRQMHKEGHIIGNHTWNHPDMTSLSADALHQEIASTSQLLENLTGQRPRLFRPPYGKTNPAVRSVIQAAGMTSVLWNVDPTDWNLKKTSTVHARVQAELLDKSLILLHDGGGPRERTVESLPLIIEQLLEQGYQFITVPEFLNIENKI